ncbi:hypothetical protein [Streptomyces griseofuscus]|uniref:hypothetical protein n=1 Tax=Streptomyces griseofuscus TaxID=146922 RepID=UPI003F51A99D
MPEPEPVVKNRTHLDLATTSPGRQAELVAPLTALGATPVDVGRGDGLARAQGDRRPRGAALRPGRGPLSRIPPGARPEDRAVSRTCLTDPEGHEFRVLTRS